MSRRRVLHVFKYFRPRFTGEGVFVERLAPVFARLRPDVGHEVLVLATPSPIYPITPPGLEGVHYLARSEAGASQSELVAWLGRNARRYDVVHHHTHVDRTFLGALALKLQGRRVMLSATLDDSIFGLLATYRPVLRPLVRRLFSLLDAFVAISPKLFEENSRYAGPDRSKLIPIGIPLPTAGPCDRAAARVQLGLPAEAQVLVSVGGICRRKDQMLLVRQLPALVRRTPGVILTLVGPTLEPDYEAEIRRFVADAGLTDHVRFVGHAPEPWVHYRAADLFVFASQQEGFGTVLIEAMAHGLPVVARGLPGVNDSFIEHGRTGFLFEAEDAFAGLVERVLSDSKLRERVGAAARGFVAANYDIEAIAARYLELYGYPTETRP